MESNALPMPPASAAFPVPLTAIAWSISALQSVGFLNSFAQSVVSFNTRVDSVRLALEACERELVDWTTLWSYSNSQPQLFKYLWGESYEDITTALSLVSDDAATLKNLILDVLNDASDGPGNASDVPGNASDGALWRYVKIHRWPILQNLAFALCSETTLARTVTRLQSNLKTLQILSDSRLKAISRSNSITADQAVWLGTLDLFGHDLFQSLHSLDGTQYWGLDIRPPDIYGDVTKWNAAVPQTLGVSLTYWNHGPAPPKSGEWARINFKCDLTEKITAPEQWKAGILARRHGDLPNPKVTDDNPLEKRTEPLRVLFKTSLFRSATYRETWKPDQELLLLSLSNWAVLLRRSGWAADVCCCAIRYVRRGADLNWHSLAMCTMGTSNECEDRRSQTHRKLENLGLVLAETICTIPFRFTNTDPKYPYQKWVEAEGRWTDIAESDMLHLVHLKSNSKNLSDAVDFCLNTTIEDNLKKDARKLADFYQLCVQIQKWCQIRETNRETLAGIIIQPADRRWPHGAWEILDLGILAAENESLALDSGGVVEPEPTPNIEEAGIRLPNHEGPSDEPLPDEETGSAVG
ncbi:hypothetical protein F5B18DRAFT_654121 [Nemania serpens]|nr:hypothetical protein F5B18DRAFT_654121 [Nemania serpens]